MGNAAEQLQNAPQPYAAELVELDNAEQQMAELREKYGTVPDYSTKEGYKAGKQAIQALTKMRTGTDKARLAITKPHRDFIEMVNQRAKGLIGEVEQLEAPHREAKREVDKTEQRAKEARIAQLRERLEKEVTSYLDTTEGLDSTGLADLIDEAEAIDTEGYFDITKEAEDERARVLATLRERHAAALERERLAAEREEIERERAELEHLRAAQAPAETSAPALSDVVTTGGTAFSQEDLDDWAGLGSALQDVPAADPFGEALEDLQAVAGLDASQAVDVLSAIQRSDIRHVSLQQ